ncbi:hypothetical protein G6F35_011008 [Rhizopus arrhizus]|nr:hypothetical protein G6F35_011008 [Rhizopus arrhizus]
MTATPSSPPRIAAIAPAPAEQGEVIPFGRAGRARGAVVVDDAGRHAHPRVQAFHIAAAFGQFQQCPHCPPAHQPEIARVGGDGGPAKAVQQAVERVSRGAFQPALPCPAASAHADDVRTLLPGPHHFGNQFRRVLEVGVQQDHRVAFGMDDAGRHGRFLAEIAAQPDQFQ